MGGTLSNRNTFDMTLEKIGAAMLPPPTCSVLGSLIKTTPTNLGEYCGANPAKNAIWRVSSYPFFTDFSGCSSLSADIIGFNRRFLPGAFGDHAPEHALQLTVQCCAFMTRSPPRGLIRNQGDLALDTAGGYGAISRRKLKRGHGQTITIGKGDALNVLPSATVGQEPAALPWKANARDFTEAQRLELLPDIVFVEAEREPANPDLTGIRKDAAQVQDAPVTRILYTTASSTLEKPRTGVDRVSRRRGPTLMPRQP